MNESTLRRTNCYKTADGAIRASAITRRPITYTELAKCMGSFPGSAVQNRALYDIVIENAKTKEPLFTSLVVSEITNMPGDGFFSAAHEMGYRYKDRIKFVIEQQNKCYQYMRDLSTKISDGIQI